ncbi:hypothetical protein D6D15_04892 [Aureobasidium pullulans]|uniref:Uncharacterized protein n=1 Tax=Aureobasidium pullulans TaxID=5580 RepID=A0A4S9BA63_AURPU|nr:hypothetical protein D6D15_04892 [Aureobasidium pullulans]
MSEPLDTLEDMDDNYDYNAEQYWNDDLGVETLDRVSPVPPQNPQHGLKRARPSPPSTERKRAKPYYQGTYTFGQVSARYPQSLSLTTTSIELVILLAKGNPVAHVSKIEFETVAKPTGLQYNEVELCKGAQLRQYSYDIDATVLHFLAHWIRYRSPSTAIKYAFGGKVSNDNSHDEDQRLFLVIVVKLINFFANEDAFKPIIKDSLVSCFAKCLKAQDQEGKIMLAEVLKNACTDNMFKHIATDIFVALLD